MTNSIDAAPQRTGLNSEGADQGACLRLLFRMHGNFDPNQPPFGVMFANREQNLNWEAVGRLLTTKVDALFNTVAPKGWDTEHGKQLTQTPRFYSLPKTQDS